MKILIIENIEDNFRTILFYLKESFPTQLSTVHCKTLSEGLSYAVSGDYDIALMNISLPDNNGTEAFTRLAEANPALPIIIVSSAEDEETAIDAVKEGASDYLVEGDFNAQLLYRTIQYSLKINKLKKRIAECNAKYSTLTENTDFMIITVDKHRRVTSFNKQFADFIKKFGGAEMTPGDNIMDYLTERTAKFINKLFDRGLNGEAFREDYQLDLSDGSKTYLSFSVHPVISEVELIGFNCFIRDITERKVSEQKINEYLSKLEKMNEAKDRFFSIVSHDLRSPAKSSLSALSLLMNEYYEITDIDRLAHIDSVFKGLQSLNSLLEELLAWSRSQGGAIELNQEKFDIFTIVENTIEETRMTAHRKSITLVNSVPKNEIVYADPNMIAVVLRNLLSNAIKFTFPSGTISISSQPQDDYFAIISVKDNGMGIEAEHISKLFRIDKHKSSIGTDKETGAGLGLVLCREFVERNKGKIWVDSVMGEGSTFKFTLPRGEI